MNHLSRTVFLTCLAAAAIVPAHADSISILSISRSSLLRRDRPT
jgi:hypothetical protein